MRQSWPKVRLGEVLTPTLREESVKADGEYRLLGVRLDGRGAFLRETVTGTTTSASKLFLVRSGDFIYSRLFAGRGAFGVIGDDLDGCFVSGEFPVFQATSDRIDARYLNHWFRLPSVLARVDENCTGSTPLTRNRFKEHFFLALEIPLPPLNEQQHIVARIEALAEQIREALRLRQEALEEAAALVAAKVVHWFAIGKANGWKSEKLADYLVDDCYGTSEKTSNDSTGTPVLRMGNIQNGRLDLNDLKYLHLTERDRERLLLEDGDILVNRTNSAELVGKCAVFNLLGEYSFASYLIRLRVDQNRTDPKLVAAYINSPMGRSFMLAEKRQMAGQANVNATKLKALPISLPQLDEQHRIVAELDALQAQVDSLKRAQAETAAELDTLLPAVLDKAFRGGVMGLTADYRTVSR